MTIHFRFSMLAIATFGLTSAFAQAQTPSADSTVYNLLARKVQRYYNQNQMDSLYALFDKTGKEQVSLETVKAGTNDMLTKQGQWKSMKLVEIKNGVAHYTTTFDKATGDFYVGRLNGDGQANTIFLSFKDK